MTRQEIEIPAVLFDGFAVYEAMTPEAKQRINAGGVSDVLDAVVRLLREERGRQAWADVPDAAAWVREIRGTNDDGPIEMESRDD